LAIFLCEHVRFLLLHNTLDKETDLNYRFVDRDMLMRYVGGGVGHRYIRQWETHLSGRYAPQASFEPETLDDILASGASAVNDDIESEDETSVEESSEDGEAGEPGSEDDSVGDPRSQEGAEDLDDEVQPFGEGEGDYLRSDSEDGLEFPDSDVAEEFGYSNL
jgi:hypothetical protein